MKSILVTGIGGGVGQGIIRNIRSMGINVDIIGTNVSIVSSGNHLCNHVHQVPYAYDPEYILFIEKIVSQHAVGLIIPSTDYEAYYLALFQSSLSAKVAASPAEVSEFCLDKYLNFQCFHAAGIPFANSFLPSNYRNQLKRIVAKPRKGRGSRNIYVDHPAPQELGDDYLIQEYLDGPELTTAVYVRQSGELHGYITLNRELDQGATSCCEVTDNYNYLIDDIINRIISTFPFRGSFNIQSRVTKNGVIPFEINCRISGTNSIRSQFGFKDVEYTVQDFLFNQTPEAPLIKPGCALRIMHDVIYPGLTLNEISNCNDKHWIF